MPNLKGLSLGRFKGKWRERLRNLFKPQTTTGSLGNNAVDDALKSKAKHSCSGRFQGNWCACLRGLFDPETGLDFRDKKILDIGCSIGIIAYEISKRNPRRIQGIDGHAPSIEVAKRIFNAVDIPSRFDVVDLRDPKAVREVITDQQDIVLLLGVDHHVRSWDHDSEADVLLRFLAEMCRSTILFRGPPDSEERVGRTLSEGGFEVGYRADGELPIPPLVKFNRVE